MNEFVNVIIDYCFKYKVKTHKVVWGLSYECMACRRDCGLTWISSKYDDDDMWFDDE